MIVSRQDELTEVSELYCRVCDRLLAVAPPSLEVVTFFYALVEGVWHRFYLDAGLLFWDEGQAPEEEEDLYEGDTYVDLSARLNVVGKAIEEIRMANGRLTLRFSGGARLVLEDRDDDTFIAESVAAR